MTNQPSSPREIARILSRHRRKIVVFFGTVVVLTFLAIALFPRTYSSEAKLFIRVGRETVALDPTATTGQTMILQKTQVDEVNSAIDLLNSEAVQRKVVELVGADRILSPKQDHAEQIDGSTRTTETSWTEAANKAIAHARAWTGEVLAALRLRDPATSEELAIRRLAQGLKVWSPKQSTVISISYRTSSPQVAHDVVDATTKAFVEQHLRLNQVDGSLEFFSEQTETLHGRLKEAEAELRDLKNEFQIASMSGKRAIFEDQIRDVELQLLRAQRELAFSEAMAADLRRAIAALEPEIVTSRVAGFANEARDAMREKLYELELQETKLRASYQDSHPLVVQIQTQREEAEQILASMPDNRTQTTSALNTNQRKLELQLAEAEAAIEAQQAQEKASREQLASLHEKLKELNEREVQISELERTVETTEQAYRMHVEKLEQARVNDALGRGQISNVKTAQSASVRAKPVWPNKPLFLAFGLLVATGGAIGLAFLAEATDQTFSTPEQVERVLRAPVLLTIARKKRQWWKRAKTKVKRRQQDGGSDRLAEAVLGRPMGSYWSLVRGLVATNGTGRGHAKTVGVVGCEPSKIRSRVAAKLAIRAAHGGAGPVLLIDADARRRQVAKQFHLNCSPGWHEVVHGAAKVQNCVHRPQVANLAVMSPGAKDSTSLTGGSPAIAGELLDEIKSSYGLVVVDLPPGGHWEGPPAAVPWLDRCVLVVEAERTRIDAAVQVKDQFERAGVPVAGVVLANYREHIPGWLSRSL